MHCLLEGEVIIHTYRFQLVFLVPLAQNWPLATWFLSILLFDIKTYMRLYEEPHIIVSFN